MKKRIPKTTASKRETSEHDATLIPGWKPVQPKGLPKYESLVEAIADGVKTGALRAGTRLPPQRDLARHFDVTIATMTKAINLAAHRGLVVTRTGSGTFVKGAADDNDADQQRAAFSDLSLNSPPVGIAAPLLQRNLKSLSDAGDMQTLFGYAPIPGTHRNRRAGSAWFALRDLQAPPEQILITQGAHEGLICTLLALTQPGDAVLCERLNYAGIIRIAQMLRIRLVGIEVDGEGIVTDQLVQYKGDSSIKAIICTPTTHNPTSATMSTARRTALVRFARSASIPIIEDDIYGLLGGAGSVPVATAWPEGVIVVSSLSKTVSPGIRLGYIAAPLAMVSRIRDAMLMLGWTEPATSAAVASQLIHSGAAIQTTLLHRDEAQKRVALAAEILGTAMLTSPDAISYHVWVNTGQLQPTDVTAELYRMGVLVSPASYFSVDAAATDSALRVSLGGVASLDDLRGPLELLANVLRGAGPMPSRAIA